MKQWTVTYREKSGVKTSVVIEAEGRAGVFAELKQRGINAISITEGAAKVSRGVIGSFVVTRGVMTWVGLLVAIIGIGLGGAWVCGIGGGGDEVSKSDSGKGGRSEDIGNGSKAKSGFDQPDLDTVGGSETNALVTPTFQEKWLGQPVIKHTVTTNNTLVIETFYTADGKKHKYYHDKREEVVKTVADQILAMMTANNPYGSPPLPYVKNFDEEFKKAIKVPIEIQKEDSQKVRDLKERILAARKEVMYLAEQGMSPSAVVREWEEMQKDNATLRLEAARNVKQLIKEGQIEAAERLCQEYNEVLESAGIMGLEFQN